MKKILLVSLILMSALMVEGQIILNGLTTLPSPNVDAYEEVQEVTFEITNIIGQTVAYGYYDLENYTYVNLNIATGSYIIRYTIVDKLGYRHIECYYFVYTRI